ncbi:extracellular solute-binding protein, partial [Cutibacterium acnes]
MYEFGASMLNEDGTKVVINSPEAVKAVEYFKKLHDEKIIPDSVWVGSENPNNLFRTGQVGVHLAGSWMLTNYRDNIKDFEWGVTYLPKEVQRSSVPGGKYIAAFNNSKVEEEAAKFIEYFTSKEVNEKYAKESLFLSPRLDNADIDYAFGKDYFKIFADELAVTDPKAGQDWSHPSLS